MERESVAQSRRSSTRHSLRRRIKAAAATAVTAAGLTVAAAPSASATCAEFGMGFTNINIQMSNVNNSYWRGVLDRAAGNWNGLGVGTNIQRVSSSAGLYAPGEYGASYFGYYADFGDRLVNRRFTIYINARQITNYARPADYDRWNRVISVHEIGHALSLAHPQPQSASHPNGLPSASYSIMQYPPNDQWQLWDLPTGYDAKEVRRCGTGPYRGI